MFIIKVTEEMCMYGDRKEYTEAYSPIAKSNTTKDKKFTEVANNEFLQAT